MKAQYRFLWCIGVLLATGSAALADIPGDGDGDLDVDVADFELLADCQLGPDVPVIGFCQAPFDVDLDADLDMTDFAAFQRCFSGEDQPASPHCANHTAKIENGCLHVIGTVADSALALRLQAGAPDMLLVDVGNDGFADFAFDRAQFDCIVINAGGGNDQVIIDEANGVFTDTEVTTILGGAGVDSLHGGSGGEIFVAGDGNDMVFLGGGDDLFIWNPGDDTDLVEGEGGVDTVEINGGGGAEVFTVTANGTRVRFDRLSPAPFALDIGTCEKLVLMANGGNDSLACTGNLAALISITADGGPGDDTLLGSNGIDHLSGGDDNDFIDGQQGNDVIDGGAGNDTIQWDPGDGNDTIEGAAGTDNLLFNGSGGAEIFTVSPHPGFPGHVQFTRNLASIVLDLNGIETLDLNTLGNTDTVTVSDLAGTTMTGVNINLAGTIGGNTGDVAADTVIVNGTDGPDAIEIVGAGTSCSVMGLSAPINITNSEGASDALVINALAGEDEVWATTLPAGVIRLTLDGGADDDTLLGSQGADVFLGGAGDDYIFGDNGDDVALMGSDNDVFEWAPGDGNDTVEGQDGADALVFSGSNAAENIDVFANGARVLLFRDVASVSMDLNDVESVYLNALGGADDIVVGDMSGTDLAEISLHLGGPDDAGDGAVDTITVNGTNNPDVFGAAESAGGVTVFGLHAAVEILFPEHPNDRLTLNALAGDDTVDASGLLANSIQLAINGGLGNDAITGGDGNDQINGGDGNDVVLMGDGDDTFVWNPGDDNDTLEGQAGTDTMLFNGANVAELINVSPNNGRILFTRNVATVMMDLNDIENIDFTARGGADIITIQDLSGTDAQEVNVNLEAVPGGGAGDALADNVNVSGTSDDDIILVEGSATVATVVGLAARVNITGGESALDSVTINAVAGHDVVDGMKLGAGSIRLVADGGTGDDILLGGAGSATLSGGDHDDVLLGGPAVDVLDGGTGDNIVIQGGTIVTTAIATIFGSDATDNITISRDAGGNLFSNGVPIPGASIANTSLIRVFGRGGDDVITLDESGGALPAAALFGGAGLDALTGGIGADLIFGGNDDDALLGKGGSDFLFAGDGNDTLTGGDASDLAFAQAGNDTFVWNPGDDTDLNEGGSGVDTVQVNGGGGAEDFTITANGTRVRFDRINPAPFSLDIGTCEALVLNANGGNDTLACTGNLAALVQITADGGSGDDTLLGSNGADLLIGGGDNDFVDGQQGNDTIFLGAGNDTFQWDPGDGSDVVEGEDGVDEILFNGSNGAEIFEFWAIGNRLQFTRNLGNIVLDADGVELFNLKALGSTDVVNVNDLSATIVDEINIDLAGTIGGSTGDSQIDAITVNGTAEPDAIHVAAVSGAVEVSGLPVLIRVQHSQSATDTLTVNGLGGTDTITSGAGVSALITLTTNQ